MHLSVLSQVVADWTPCATSPSTASYPKHGWGGVDGDGGCSGHPTGVAVHWGRVCACR